MPEAFRRLLPVLTVPESLLEDWVPPTIAIIRATVTVSLSRRKIVGFCNGTSEDAFWILFELIKLLIAGRVVNYTHTTARKLKVANIKGERPADSKIKAAT